MIKQSTVFIAQPIVNDMLQNGHSLFKRTGNVVKGLNEVSYGVVPYEAESAPVTIPEVTASTAAHSQHMDELSTLVAEKVRSSFGQISKFLRPLSNTLATDLKRELNFELNATSTLFNGFRVTWQRLDPDFFESSLYPAASNGGLIDFTAISQNDLRFPGTITRLDNERTQALVNIDNPTVQEIINTVPAGVAFNDIIIGNRWTEYFNVTERGINFRSPTKACPDALFSLYLLLTKLNVMDEPIEEATSVDLDAYQSWLGLTRKCVAEGLAAYKQSYTLLSSLNFPILQDSLVKDRYETYGINILRGNLTVGCTSKMISEFTALGNPNVSISEYLIGQAIVRLIGLPVGVDPMKNTPELAYRKEYFGNVYNTFVKDISNGMAQKLDTAAVAIVERAINRFQKDNPAFDAIIGKPINVPEYRRLTSKLTPEINNFVRLLKTACVENDVSIDDFVSGADLIWQIGEKTGMELAAGLLRDTAVKSGDGGCVVAQRERLTEATVRLLTRLLTKY